MSRERGSLEVVDAVGVRFVSSAAVVEPARAWTDDEEARRAYAGKLLPATQLRLFRDPHWVFATRKIARGKHVFPLLRASRQLSDLPVRANDTQYDLADYISRNRVVGLLILKHGRIVLEHYEADIDSESRWISMSMAKSISTTLIGAAIQDGLIGSVDDPLTRYLPQLAGGGYDGVSIRHLLQMTSGVQWDDTHTDPASERRQMLELQIAQQPDAILRFVANQRRIAEPGMVWNYSTGETHVVGALVRAAVGRWVADYLSEKIWAPFGMQSDATWWLESPHGLEVAGSGISATLRDYARFGQFILDDGIIGSTRVLPEGWIREATAPRQVGGQPLNYGYMWWAVPARGGGFEDRAFSARGIFGQYIYINPGQGLVVTVLSARSKPRGAEVILDNDFFNSVVEALR
ncbi:MAG TPA: serine hydrolase [Steroidobacteraceae bacterium]|nr:serine hydrolase [Steroidobacteraceae bacterium]